jgi:hypothetical protein
MTYRGENDGWRDIKKVLLDSTFDVREEQSIRHKSIFQIDKSMKNILNQLILPGKQNKSYRFFSLNKRPSRRRRQPVKVITLICNSIKLEQQNPIGCSESNDKNRSTLEI